ncbi:GALNT10 [Symbiodinium natans]|uniref:tRNA-uridine aminocarboxypropyltransferase n=1 Tax=Symbiodinium natans TaxID=878477 RepID=A0A812Q8I7_9DINO|nr:GALNT10 [Symbiodinium natans]
MLREDFQQLEVVLCRQLEREVLEGTYHTGLASVVQFVARRGFEPARPLAEERKDRYRSRIDAIFDEAAAKEPQPDSAEEDPFLSVAGAGVRYAIQASEADARCRYCWLPQEFCVCGSVTEAIEVQQVHFALLCHPLEFLRSSSSGKLLPCVLGADLFVFGVGAHADRLDEIINDRRTHFLLPGDGSRSLEEWLSRPVPEDAAPGKSDAENRRLPLILLVPDGSWEQVQALRSAVDRRRSADGLPPVPCLRLQEAAVQAFHSPLIDALKPGAGKGRISTFEACALFLREAEDVWPLPPGTWKNALRALEPMVEALRRTLFLPEPLEATGVPTVALENAVRALQKVAPSAPLRDGLRRCVVCGAAFATPLRMRDHLRGRRHCTAVALQHFRECGAAGYAGHPAVDDAEAQRIFTAFSTTPLSHCSAEPPDVALVMLKREGLLQKPSEGTDDGVLVEMRRSFLCSRLEWGHPDRAQEITADQSMILTTWVMNQSTANISVLWQRENNHAKYSGASPAEPANCPADVARGNGQVVSEAFRSKRVHAGIRAAQNDAATEALAHLREVSPETGDGHRAE